MTWTNRLSTDGSCLTVLETFLLARLALNGLPRADEVQRAYGYFNDRLDDLESDLRAAGGDVDLLLCKRQGLINQTIGKRRTTRRCSCT